MDGIQILGLIFISYLIYKRYFKPVKTIEAVFYRGFHLRLIGLKQKERDVYLRALENKQFSNLEKRDINFNLGIWFMKAKDYAKAISFFDQAFEEFEEVFHYKKEFHQVLDSYIACGQTERAEELLHYFLSRKHFDKRFTKLEKSHSDLL